jgi:hypothetical protein
MCIVVFSTYTVFMKELAWRKWPRKRINGDVVIKHLNTRAGGGVPASATTPL